MRLGEPWFLSSRTSDGTSSRDRAQMRFPFTTLPGGRLSPSAMATARSLSHSSTRKGSSRGHPRSRSATALPGGSAGSRSRSRIIARPSPETAEDWTHSSPPWTTCDGTRASAPSRFARSCRCRGYRMSRTPTCTRSISRSARTLCFSRSTCPQVQRSIRRSVRDGVLLRRGEREQDVTHTYHGLHVDTRRRHGIPTQPRRFFQLVWKRLLEPGLGYLSLAYTGGEPVAGAIFLIDGGHTISYKYAASDPRFWGVRPNHAVIWDGIRWGCENGFRQFDFGVTHLPDESLRAFKSRWAAQEQTVVDARLGDRRRARHAMPAAARRGASLVDPPRAEVGMPGPRGRALSVRRLNANAPY